MHGNNPPPASTWSDGRTARFVLSGAIPSVLTSTVFHVVLFLVLALMIVTIDDGQLVQEFVMDDQRDDLEEIDDLAPPIIERLEDAGPIELRDFFDDDAPLDADLPEDVAAQTAEAIIAVVTIEEPLGIDVSHRDFGKPIPRGKSGGPLGQRGTAEKRLTAAIDGGGDKDTEAALARALKWLASRQSRDDGGWNFDHNQGRPVNPVRCPDPGSADVARNGATGIVLLPFLGAGQTHQAGVYQDEVRAGLKFLIQRMKVDRSRQTGSWHEPAGSMYSHGICAIAMCEAYAMTHDKDLLAPAQLALNYIVYAQDPVGGGWRYQPQQAGDTSAMGWQLMALKSGHMGYLTVPDKSVRGAHKFLDSVQSDSGAKYGYNKAGGGQATTAVGLLSRMYLGWKHDHAALARGAAFLDRSGPSTAGNMYYNYYATQVCHHYEGEVWKRWNARMKPWLLKTQSTDGPAVGSWYFRGGDHGAERGGRLYCTAMGAMMLEVYYRHQPIYQKQATDEDFAL